MNEFFREVDEEYRRDQIARFWSRYNGLLVALAVLLVAGIGGYRYYESVQRSKAEAFGVRYDEALRASRDGKPDDAEKTLEALARDGSGGYKILSRFRLAAEIGREKPDEGAKAFDALAADASLNGTLQDLARLRAAMLRLDTVDPANLRPQLERLAAPTNPWRHSARELLGVSGLKAGDTNFAGRWFDQIAADRDTPPGLRQRLELYAALVAAGPVKSGP